MKLIPVMTEKSMKLINNGGFTFWVSIALTKTEIKKLVNKTFNVNVESVKVTNFKARSKRNNRGQTQKIKAQKKAIVFLKAGEKIDLFIEEKKKPKTKKKKATEQKAK